MTAEAHGHRTSELCQEGLGLYTRALREGRVRARDADGAPCLVDLGLLQPTVQDLDWLEPLAPAVALHRLLRASEDRIADERRREERLTEMFDPLLALAAPDTAGIRVLSDIERIDQAIAHVLADASTEVLAIQPYNRRPHRTLVWALERDQAFLDRGGRIRTLYQHTYRHAPAIRTRYELLKGDAEARSLDELPERLILVDRTVAYIPANKDRTLALEVRHPALVSYLGTTFDRLWPLAVPMYPEAVHQPSLDGITPRQRAIAALLVEGHTDAVIADRLGMNIRTARVHIAKLAATLGSDSRAQLGYLIGQSGILAPEE
ncbi:helix-turn-helix transcriptional regulator [Streptomyces sp. NPDC002838]|uniref:helix-turn-helix transcriptional regulator n=1 Tax=Streptomyces sp. NPDC002838 TaxID=3154436 RepID=UPI00331EAD67